MEAVRQRKKRNRDPQILYSQCDPDKTLMEGSPGIITQAIGLHLGPLVPLSGG